MTPLIEKTWDLINVGASLMCETDDKMSADFEVKEFYFQTFKKIHNQVLEYMENTNNPLDRHKIAAIIMVATIKSSVLSSSNEKDIFTGNYVLATEVGLSYMLGELNELLKEHQLPLIERFFFPKAISCDTDYFRIFYRNLYYANTNPEWGLNPLDIAERLFLLEYMTLEKNNINPLVLKQY